MLFTTSKTKSYLHQACCNLDRAHNGDWIHAALQQQYRVV